MASIKELRSICQASAPNPQRESLAGRFARFFSIYMTKLLLNTKLTPNQITVLSTLVFFAGIGLFFIDIYSVRIAGAVLVFLSVVLDGSDGEVARYRKTGDTIGGDYVEPVSHDIQYGFSFLIFGAALYSLGYHPLYLLLGASASVFKLEYRFLKLRFWNLKNLNITKEEISKIQDSYGAMPACKRMVYWIDKNFFSSPSLYAVLFFFSLIDRPEYFLWFYSSGFCLFFLAIFAKQVIQINNRKI
jgi:hypothetical protein